MENCGSKATISLICQELKLDLILGNGLKLWDVQNSERKNISSLTMTSYLWARYRHPSTLKQSLMHLYNKFLCLKIAKKVYEAEAAGLNYSIDGDFAPCKWTRVEFLIYRKLWLYDVISPIDYF